MRIDLNLKEGVCGEWELKKFTVTPEEAKFDYIRFMFNGFKQLPVEAGIYWKLTQRGNIYMSNTPSEVKDHWSFIRNAHGSVLIAGLGLGMVVRALLDKGKCTRIVVVEKSEDVLKLVSPYYNDKRVEIIHSDIFNYKPNEHFNFAWFDIWRDICGDNYPEMKKLNRKFAHTVNNKDSWRFKECKRLYYANKDE